MKIVLILSIYIVPLTLCNELEEFSAGNKLFTASIYKELPNSNFILSPFSLESVLALLHSGAKDSTADELRTGLHFPENIENVFKNFNPYQDNQYVLRGANKIYLKPGFKVQDEFKKRAQEIFASDIENVNFDNGISAAGTINKWVEEKTEQKIKNLVKAANLNSRTRSVLVNSLYLRANWTVPFKIHRTKNLDFYQNGDKLVPVKTMQQISSHNYFEDEQSGLKFLEIKLEGTDLTMTIVLPKEKEGIFELDQKLERVFAKPEFQNLVVNVSLPKFKIGSQIDVKKILQKLGVKKIFKPEEADLSGISGNKGDLIVDDILQKTVIEVGENGVEAASASFALVGVPLSSLVFTQTPKQFIADHPFIFYIKKNDVILFAGKVLDPLSH